MSLNVKHWVTRTIIVAAVAVVVGCSGDAPTGPSKSAGYTFYFNDQFNESRIFAFDTGTDTLRSLTFPTAVFQQIAISPDGGRLYFGNSRVTGIADIATQSVISQTSIPCHNGLAASPDGTLLALCGESLVVVRSDDLSVVFHDSTPVIHADFSSDGAWLSGGVGTDVYWTHFIGDTIEYGRMPVGNTVWRVSLSKDGSTWIVYLTMPSLQSAVMLWPLRAAQPEYFRYLGGSFGDMQLTPLGRGAVLTCPGWSWGGPVLDQAFYVLDPGRSHAIDTVRTSGLTNRDGRVVEFVARACAVSGDGRYFGLVNGKLDQMLAIYDSQKGTIIRSFDFTGDRPSVWLNSVVCGRDL